MKYVNRIVGNLVFLSAFVLSGWLAWQFHGADNVVALGVAGLALVLSAFGLVFARHSWSQKAAPEFILGLGLWIVGAGAFTITELGYWFSTYNERHAEYQQIKKAKTRTEGLRDQAWTALTTGQVPMTSAQIKADLEGKRLDPIYSRSKSCTDATLSDSRALCAEIFALKSQLAAATKREALEIQVASSIGPVKEETYIHDVFAQAEMLASLLGIDEKQAATVVILSTWLLLMLARDTGLLVANPMGRRKAAEKAQEPGKASPVSVAVYPPRRPAGMPDVIEKIQAKPAIEAPLPPEPETPPDGDGTPVETSPEVSVPAPTTVVNFPKPLSKREKAKQKKQRVEQENRRLVESFVVDRLDTDHALAQIELTAKGGHCGGGTSGDDIYQEFRRYCKSRGVPGVGKSHLGRFIGEFVDRARNHKGVVYGAVVRSEIRKRKAA